MQNKKKEKGEGKKKKVTVVVFFSLSNSIVMKRLSVSSTGCERGVSLGERNRTSFSIVRAKRKITLFPCIAFGRDANTKETGSQMTRHHYHENKKRWTCARRRRRMAKESLYERFSDTSPQASQNSLFFSLFLYLFPSNPLLLKVP